MPLCQPKTKTPALLAACRANALKGTGPRTAEGKCRSRLNALKHGRFSPNFRENLAQAGREMGVRRFDFIRSHVLKFLPPVTQEQKRKVEELARAIWCWAEKKEKAFGRKQRSSMDSVSYRPATLPFARLRIRDRNGRTLVSVTLGYQRRRAGEGWSLARAALTLTPGKGSSVYQEQQAMWRAAWVLSQMPVLMTGARPVPRSLKELEQGITAHAHAALSVASWRPKVVIWLRPVRYREPLPCRPRRRPTAAGRPNVGWMEKLLGLFRRKRDEPEPPELSARGSDGRALCPSALDDPTLSRGYAYGKDFCRVLGYVDCYVALAAERNRGASASQKN
jgi:hypothetical protein